MVEVPPSQGSSKGLEVEVLRSREVRTRIRALRTLVRHRSRNCLRHRSRRVVPEQVLPGSSHVEVRDERAS